jgi:hypothetical protein
MFMGLKEVEQQVKYQLGTGARLFGKAHAHARTDAEVRAALDQSGEMVRRDIIGAVETNLDASIKACSWTDYIGPYIDAAHAVAQRHRDVAERIYTERVRTRPSYASLHAIDPGRGLRRTIANNVFYIAEAMYLRDNPDTAVVNFEYADTFWKGLEDILAKEVWGEWRPFVGMVRQDARQPWGY